MEHPATSRAAHDPIALSIAEQNVLRLVIDGLANGDMLIVIGDSEHSIRR